MTEHSDRQPEEFYLYLSLVWLQTHCGDCSGNNHEEVCLAFCKRDCILPVRVCVIISEKVPSQLYLNIVRDEASLSVLPPPQSLQCIFLSAGLLTPVRYMTWAQRTRQAENKHLTWVLLSSVVFRQTSPHGGDLSLHQPELLKGLTHCLYRVLLETNGI